jgi:hypothetical protein
VLGRVVYANHSSDETRHERAIAVMEAMLRQRCGVISIPVMQEYANAALVKLRQEPSVILRQLALLEHLTIVGPTPQLVRRGVEIHLAHGASYLRREHHRGRRVGAPRRLAVGGLHPRRALRRHPRG